MITFIILCIIIVALVLVALTMKQKSKKSNKNEKKSTLIQRCDLSKKISNSTILSKTTINNEKTEEIPVKTQHPYKIKKDLFSHAELSFLGILDRAIPAEYRVFGKVRIADLITPDMRRDDKMFIAAFNQISAKHVDYVICERASLKPVIVVELDDKSHNTKKSRKRDEFVNKAFLSEKLKMIRFEAKSGYNQKEVESQISNEFKSH